MKRAAVTSAHLTSGEVHSLNRRLGVLRAELAYVRTLVERLYEEEREGTRDDVSGEKPTHTRSR